MWEAIKSNQRRSRVLIVMMGGLLLALGFLIGLTVDPQFGGMAGVCVAFGIFLMLLMSAFFAGNEILLAAAGAHRIEKDDAPRLWNVVEEMTIASGMPSMPAVYIIDEDAPNAFAVGRRPEQAAVAVTSGLVKRLTRDELQGVIAHEIAHIKNYDTRFMTLAGVMVGAITLLGEIFLRSLRFHGRGRRSSGSGGGGQAQLIIFAVTIVAAILAPVFARLLYFACSRRREYLADASAARFTRYPEGLASALEKIARRSGGFVAASRVVAPMFIVNPLRGFPDIDLFSTHPPTEARVMILRAMGGGAGLADYEAAFRKVQGEKNACLGRETLVQADRVAARAANPEPEPQEEAIGRAREAADLLGRIGQFLYLPCACGMNLKVPPAFPGEAVVCPRCGTRHEVPKAQPAVPAPEAAAAGTGRPGKVPELTYQRKQTGWESFRCDCGQTIQLSPLMVAPRMTCPKCRRKVTIVPAKEGVGAAH